MLDILSIFKEHQKVIDSLGEMIPILQKSVEKIITSLKSHGTIFWMGNGGSAADAQHMAAELVGRFKIDRPGWASIALTTDSSILTSVSNDYGFDMIFSRQIEALCQPQDILIGLSTSGNSKNVLLAIEAAKKIGAYTIGFTGHEGGKLKDLSDLCFVINSKNTARIQEAHQLLCHILCESVEEKLTREIN